jgi:uncharacterized membrane protein YdjX (TVP38/TMEM64 family)
MSSPLQPVARRWQRKHFLLAAGLAVVTLAVGFVAVKFNVRPAIDALILALREAGPGVFFVAMALLPAVGFPLAAFTLAAGPLFGPSLGTPAVIGWSLAAVMANQLLSYWLADRALRPFVTRLLAYFEFRLPDGATDAWQLTLLVRLAPGVPYWVQSYLLALVRVPLVPYLVVSMAVMTGFIVAFVVGGEAVMHGNGRLGLIAIAVLVASATAMQLARKRMARRLAVTPAGNDLP